MPLARRRGPFDHPEWLFELQYDGFRALLSIGSQRPELILRNANMLTRFGNLALFIDRELALSLCSTERLFVLIGKDSSGSTT
jgi:ATP-dependent DNA ligase